MSTTKQRCTFKERFWRRMVRQWLGSRQSARAFCRERGLATPSFYAWRRLIQQRDAAAVAFVPVRVVPDEEPTAAASASGGLELVLPAGRLLRVGPGFDGPTLQRLLALLEEGRP
jgi:transposase